jgi:prolipoprotein diacylglyceryltransferase
VWLSSRARPRLRVGDLVAIMFIWIGGVRFLIEFMRIGNWRLGDIPTAQIFGAAFVVIGLGILWYRRRQGAPILAPAPAPAPAQLPDAQPQQ